MAGDVPKLKQTLRGFQVFFIVISAVIGGGIFNNNGEALEVAGPAGLMVSVVVMGIIAISVSECISELTQQFPVTNAIVEYVRTFVDEDLGWVVGFAYWYAFASVFALQNLAAAGLSTYWNLTQTLQTIAFYFVTPLAILFLNLWGVFYYGIVETIGGALKCILVLGVSILLYVIAAKEHDGDRSGPINDGFQNDKSVADNSSIAVCYAIPIVAYSYIGIEAIAVTAFEAKNSTSLKWPSKIIAYAIFVMYFLCTLGEVLTVKWTDPRLPLIYGGVGNGTTSANTNTPPNSTIIVVNAAWAAGYRTLAGFLNGCLIFSALSASNTDLYVSSRTLYGIARDISPQSWLGKIVRFVHLSVVTQTGVPAGAILFSFLSFIWLPFLQWKGGYAIQDLIEIISVSASVSCLVVWATLCIAFIRYQKWVEMHDKGLEGEYGRYRRGRNEYKAYTFFSWIQPKVAWIGLIGCILVFAFTSVTWWNTSATFSKVAVAYAAHVILLALFIVSKIISGRPWVHLSPDISVLVRELKRLAWLKNDEILQQTDVELRFQNVAAQEDEERVDPDLVGGGGGEAAAARRDGVGVGYEERDGQ